MIHYSCIGATGYVCGEVLRMMVNHHEGELVNVLDTYGVGDAISTHHPALRGFYDQVIMDLTEENVRETAKKSDVIMIQVPSGDVAKWAEIVLAEDCAIIDIGADIRFRDVDVWEKWYGQKHPDAKMTHDAVYCIPEVMRDLAKNAAAVCEQLAGIRHRYLILPLGTRHARSVRSALDRDISALVARAHTQRKRLRACYVALHDVRRRGCMRHEVAAHEKFTFSLLAHNRIAFSAKLQYLHDIRTLS